MSESSRSPPRDRKIRSERSSHRDAPYRRDSRRGFRFLLINFCLLIESFMTIEDIAFL